MKTTISLIIFSLFFSLQTEAQLLKDLAKKASEKLDDALGEHISDDDSDFVSEEVNEILDDWIDSSKQKKEATQANQDQASSQSSQTSQSQVGDSNDPFASNAVGSDLPDAYHFDYQMVIEIGNGKGDPMLSTMYLSSKESIIGFMNDENGEKMMTIMDFDRDVHVMYMESAGTRMGQRLPSFSGLAKAMIKEGMDDHQMENLGEQKSIAGVMCTKYRMEDKNSYHIMYISNSDYGIKWNSSMLGSLSQSQKDQMAQMKGLLMYSDSFKKKNDKLQSRWETKTFQQKSFTINNAEWGL